MEPAFIVCLISYYHHLFFKIYSFKLLFLYRLFPNLINQHGEFTGLTGPLFLGLK